MIECIFSYGGSLKHKYREYKTLFLRKKAYRCVQCGNKLTVWQYEHWKDMWKERDRLISNWMKNEVRNKK